MKHDALIFVGVLCQCSPIFFRACISAKRAEGGDDAGMLLSASFRADSKGPRSLSSSFCFIRLGKVDARGLKEAPFQWLLRSIGIEGFLKILSFPHRRIIAYSYSR